MRDDEVGKHVIDRGSEENDAVLEQPRIDVIRAFASIGLFDYDWDQHAVKSFPRRYPDYTQRGCADTVWLLSLNDRVAVDEIQRLVRQDLCAQFLNGLLAACLDHFHEIRHRHPELRG